MTKGSWLTRFKVLAARLQFRKECGHPGIVHGRSFLAQFSDPIFDEVDFRNYQR